MPSLEFPNLSEMSNAVVEVSQPMLFGRGAICHSHDAFPQRLELLRESNRITVSLEAHNGFGPDIQDVRIRQLLYDSNSILENLKGFELCVHDLALKLFVDHWDWWIIRRHYPHVALGECTHEFAILLASFLAARSAFLRFLRQPIRSQSHRRAYARHEERDLPIVHCLHQYRPESNDSMLEPNFANGTNCCLSGGRHPISEMISEALSGR